MNCMFLFFRVLLNCHDCCSRVYKKLEIYLDVSGVSLACTSVTWMKQERRETQKALLWPRAIYRPVNTLETSLPAYRRPAATSSESFN